MVVLWVGTEQTITAHPSAKYLKACNFIKKRLQHSIIQLPKTSTTFETWQKMKKKTKKTMTKAWVSCGFWSHLRKKSLMETSFFVLCQRDNMSLIKQMTVGVLKNNCSWYFDKFPGQIVFWKSRSKACSFTVLHMYFSNTFYISEVISGVALVEYFFLSVYISV